MALQPFQISAGLSIDDSGLILTGTGIPGSGTDDGTAQSAPQGSIYFQTGASATLYQKTGTGATTGDWEALVFGNDIEDLTDLRTLTGTTTGDTDLGTFTGGIIADNSTIKGGLQALETYAEATRNLVENFEWQESVIDRFDPTAATPATPSTGDRYLSTATANGWTENYIYEWNGSAWVETIPTVGTYVSVDDEPTVLYAFGGSSWSAKAFESTTASTGLTKVGVDIRLDASSAGAGLGFSAGELSVNVTGAIEIVADTLQIAANGINETHIDFGTGVNQVSASDLPILDSGNLITATDVEGALAENRTAIDAIEDNTITSPNGSVAVAGTVGGDNQTVDVVFSTTGEANRSIEASSLASTANGLGASLIGVEDSAGNYTATTVEGVLTEIDGRLDALEAISTVQIDTLGNTGGAAVTADSVIVDDVIAVTWHLLIQDVVTGDREYAQISAIHNGTPSLDATAADYNVYSKLRLSNISGESIVVDVNGTGAAQTMRLRVNVPNNFDVRVVKSEQIVF